MKRFWEEAVAVPRLEGGFGVLLDGRPLRLPGGAVLAAPHQVLAEAIAAEWQTAGGAKGGEMSMEEVPLTRLLGTAQDRVAADPAAMIEGLLKYGETDLLCYRAEDHRLAARQASAWQPLLEWAALALDAPLLVTSGLMPVAQPPTSLSALRRVLAGLDIYTLVGLGVAVPALGSLILGLALEAGRLDAAEAHRLAAVDEDFQAEFWGADADAAAARADRAADVALADRFMSLIRP